MSATSDLSKQTMPEPQRLGLLRPAVQIDGRFQNPVPTDIGGVRTMLQVLPLLLLGRAERVPKEPLGPFRTDAAVFAVQPASGLRVTWMGHSGMLLEIDGVRVLIDPVWEERASPVQMWGPKRFFAPPMRLEDVPPLDVVLVSHNHYDHLGATTIRTLARQQQTADAVWVTSLGVGPLLRELGVPAVRLTELNWTESREIRTKAGAPLTVRAWPARHFSARGIRDRFQTLWSSFSLHGAEHAVYFGADSGYWEGFAPIAEAAGGFDLTMLEIGAFDEMWAAIHLGPDCAIQAFQEMDAGRGRAGLLMPIHWGLFDLGLHAWRQPIERLVELREQTGVPLWVPRPGVPTECVRQTPYMDTWWRQQQP